jgi:CBS domain containing-hemolysin-like protein
MTNLSLQIAIIIALTLLNGLLAMSETALVSSRKARLKQRAEAGERKSRWWCRVFERTWHGSSFTTWEPHSTATSYFPDTL